MQIFFLYGREEICFWAARVGKQKKRNPLQDGTLPWGDRSGAEFEANILGSIYFLDLGISEEMDVLDVFPVSDLPLRMFFLRKRLNGLAGENTVNQMWFRQTNGGDSLPPKGQLSFVRRGVSRQLVHATKVLNIEKSRGMLQVQGGPALLLAVPGIEVEKVEIRNHPSMC